MKMKTYHGTEKTKNRISKAIQDLSSIVAETLGPGGRPVLLKDVEGRVTSTKDGVTVARSYQADGDLEDAVAQAAIEICERTVRDAGDGTTTAIVLGAALVREGHNFMKANPHYSPQRLARELKNLYQLRVKPEIEKMSISIRDLDKEKAGLAIRHVALISANGDQEIAEAVAQAVEGVGEDGIVIAEEGAGTECRVSFEPGFAFTSGLGDLGGSAGPSFVNRKDLGDCMVEGSYVVLYDGEINDISTILPVLQRIDSEVDSEGRAVKSPVVFFAHRYSDQVLKMMAQNFRRGTLTVVPIITPRNGQNDGRSGFLHDVAAYTGAMVFDAQGCPLTEAHLPQLGFCRTLKLGRSEGVIIGEPELESIEKRIDELKAQMQTRSEFDQDMIRYRIGRLTGGVSTVFAGGKSAFEAKERHARVTDAICAVRSALQHGVVPGGGALLAVIAKSFKMEPGPIQVYHFALRAPLYQILENAGIDPHSFDEDMSVGHHPKYENKEIDNRKTGFYVYDAVDRESVEWWDAGIMDPKKVTLSAVENALSVAQLLMTLGGAIVPKSTEGEDQVKQIQQGLMKAMEGELP
jgi:chaperonin GroEL